jgi:hypothetical protein
MLFSTFVYIVSTVIPGVCGAAIASISAPAPSKWVHPGAMISQSQLDFIKERVNGNEQPWLDAYNALLEDVKVAVAPSPHVIVECGSYSIPDVGCKVERDDSISAYGNALAWAISGETKYAQQAINIMDAYASTIKGHNNSNAPLQSGWVGSIWARTGELIRYTDAGWPDDSIDQFASMLRNVYMPLTVGGTDHNVANWELGMFKRCDKTTSGDGKYTYIITSSHDRSCYPHVSLP